MANFNAKNKTITLTRDELNNYEFPHLLAYLRNIQEGSGWSITYKGTEYSGVAGYTSGDNITKILAFKDNGGDPDLDAGVIFIADNALNEFGGISITNKNTRPLYKWGVSKKLVLTELSTFDITWGKFDEGLTITIGGSWDYGPIADAIQVDLKTQKDFKISQTPSVLVGRPESRERKTILKVEWDNYTDENKVKVLGEVFGPLSPNPAHSGFDKQFFVDSLPEYPDQADINALFIIPQVKGDKVIGYEQWTFDVNTNKWRKVYGSNPNLRITKAPAKQAPQGANPPKQAFAQIFNGNVAINNGKLYINGKEVTPGQGGGGDSGNHPNVYEVSNILTIPTDILDQLKGGDIVNSVLGGITNTYLVVVAQPNSVTLWNQSSTDTTRFVGYEKDGGAWQPGYLIERVPTCRLHTTDISDLTYESLLDAWLGDVIDEELDDESNLWTFVKYEYDDSDDGQEIFYFCKIEDDSLTFVRYLINNGLETATFDTSYGTDGYNVIPLGGSGGTKLYKHTVAASRSITYYCVITTSGATFSDTSTSQSYNLVIISKTSTPYTSKTDIENDKDNIISVQQDNQIVEIKFTAGNLASVKTNIGADSKLTIEQTYFKSTITDNVTEL